ncbi:MAG: flagellar basal body-associated FliL family protein [Peptococcaceae bacterium]|nr:flagellar basal body-associated FliL family protein [Peptococcaceae bacterium]
MKKAVIVIVGLVLVAAVSAGVSYFFLSTGGKGLAKTSTAPPKNVQKVFGPIVDIGTFTVNLQGGTSFLKVDVNLELTGKPASTEVQGALPVVENTIINVLTTKSLQDVSTTSGKQSLRQQIMSTVNQALGGSPVQDVLFTSYMYQ